MTEKKCSKCKESKPLTLFNRDKGNADGLRSACKSCRAAITKAWRNENRQHVNNQARQYKRDHADKISEIAKRSQSKRSYKDRRNARNKIKPKDKRIKERLRIRIYHALKGLSKAESSVKLLGCSEEEARAHIESLFQPGMTWDNWSRHGWHIDHILPLDSFDLSDPEQLHKACYYTNLQPLWAKDNLKKSNKILSDVQ